MYYVKCLKINCLKIKKAAKNHEFILFLLIWIVFHSHFFGLDNQFCLKRLLNVKFKIFSLISFLYVIIVNYFQGKIQNVNNLIFNLTMILYIYMRNIILSRYLMSMFRVIIPIIFSLAIQM